MMMSQKSNFKGDMNLLLQTALVCKQRRRLSRKIYLPPELVDHICSYLHDDLEALRQCSLVCRSWALSSSRYLFRKAGIPICPHTWGNAGQRATCLCVLSHGGRVADIRHRFTSASRFRSIRDLRLYCAWVPPRHMKFSEALEVYSIPVIGLRELLESLPHLKSLELSHDYIQSSSTGPRRLDGSRRLERLVFVCRTGTIFDPDPYIDILHLFHEVTRLEFHKLPDPSSGGKQRRFADISSTPALFDTFPIVQSVEFACSSSEAVATVLDALFNNIDTASLLKLTFRRLHFRPKEALHTVLPYFLSHCTNLESLTCDPALFRLIRNLALPRLRELNVHGKLRFDETQRVVFTLPGEQAQFTNVNILRSGWLDIFHTIPDLVLPTLERIFIHFDLHHTRLSQTARNRTSWGRAETDLLDTLHSTTVDFWSFLDRLVGRAKSISVHMELHIPAWEGHVLHKERYLQLIQAVAESRMPAAAKDAVEFYVS